MCVDAESASLKMYDTTLCDPRTTSPFASPPQMPPSFEWMTGPAGSRSPGTWGSFVVSAAALAIEAAIIDAFPGVGLVGAAIFKPRFDVLINEPDAKLKPTFGGW